MPTALTKVVVAVLGTLVVGGLVAVFYVVTHRRASRPSVARVIDVADDDDDGKDDEDDGGVIQVATPANAVAV